GVDLGHAELARVNLNAANLFRTYLGGANLSGAHLSGANMCEARLGRANLRSADLSRANFENADLGGALLSSTDLREAGLIDANLSRASFNDANLKKASLNGAHLAGTSVVRTDLSDAHVGNTIFCALDLRETKGLESLIHDSPSSIGLDTIYLSGGQLPDVFLRGCGAPENFIEFKRSLIDQAFDFYSCFISYSHADKTFARRLHDALQGRGIRCWLDEHQLLPGHDTYEEVDRRIRFWDKVLLCASENSLRSSWVDDEISRAFDKERELMKNRGEKGLALVPLNLDGYLISGGWSNAKSGQVKQRLAADFTGWETDNTKFESQFERLVRALQTDGGREPVPEVKL
ncbi:MAG TPA: toll/interleukin-1 receptor domain-containing protein, partial [Blastocatellia bacterium]|nr:toll/interleukin-1 receptor domain-containing protein [Blastocatellia bacterium]